MKLSRVEKRILSILADHSPAHLTGRHIVDVGKSMWPRRPWMFWKWFKYPERGSVYIHLTRLEELEYLYSDQKVHDVRDGKLILSAREYWMDSDKFHMWKSNKWMGE